MTYQVMNIPNTAEELIRQLERQYPPKCIQQGQTPEEAHRYAGAVDLVQTLKQSLETMNRKYEKHVQGTQSS